MLITLYFPKLENSDSIDVPLVKIPKSPSLRCSQEYFLYVKDMLRLKLVLRKGILLFLIES